MDIKKILSEEKIIILFQPVFSVKKKDIIGVEALARGYVDGDTTALIPYPALYAEAKRKNLLVDLDRLCRKKAVESYRNQLGQNAPYLLFLNFDVSVLDYGVLGSNRLRTLIEENGLRPDNIIIELIETEISNIENLISFVHLYRERGFLFALDDFGERFSNLERLAVIRPDIIKVAKTVFKSNKIDKEYRRSLLSGLATFISRLGAIPLVEGVEETSELLEGIDAGFDFYQGFLFSPPVREIVEDELLKLRTNLLSLFHSSFQHRLFSIQKKRTLHQQLLEDAKKIAQGIEGQASYIEPKSLLKNLISSSDQIECLYLLNRNGIQISPTIFRNHTVPGRGVLFSPASEGTDHSEKDYFLHLLSGAKQYFSMPYISYATGEFCITISLVITQGWFKGNIICLDFSINKDSSFLG